MIRLPDYRIARSDDAADLADEERAEWIAERAAELEAQYKKDPVKRAKAVSEFMEYADTTDLDLTLRLFLAAYENAQATASVAEAANDLAKSLRSYIDPILKEWAGDHAIAERNRMEIAADVEKFEQRSAA